MKKTRSLHDIAVFSVQLACYGFGLGALILTGLLSPDLSPFKLAIFGERVEGRVSSKEDDIFISRRAAGAHRATERLHITYTYGEQTYEHRTPEHFKRGEVAIGSPIFIFVNPHDPSNAGLSRFMSALLVSVCWLGVVVATLLMVYRARKIFY